MIFKNVMEVGDALLLPFGEVDRCIVQTEVSIVPDGLCLHGTRDDLVTLLAFHQAVRVVDII